MKHTFKWLLALLLVPFVSQAQQPNVFNYVYDYYTDHDNSRHLCADQLENELIVAGSTLNGSGSEVVQLSVVDASNGAIVTTPFVFSVPGMPTRAVDLIKSDFDPEWVIVVAHFDAFPGIESMVVFKADPFSGSVQWARNYTDAGMNTVGAAITSDQNGNYYILGEREDGSGNKLMYMAAIDDSGSPLWERVCGDGSGMYSFNGVDLLFDPNSSSIIMTANIVGPFNDGAIIAEVDPGSGSIIQSYHIQEVASTPDFEVRDMTLLSNGNYVLVGVSHVGPDYGFLLQFEPGLNPHSPFSQVYPPYGSYDQPLTGIRESNWGDLYASFEYRAGASGFAYPGIIEMDPDGNPMNAFLYIVDEYRSSVGLLDLYEGQYFMVKGATGVFGSPEYLSLVTTEAPLYEERVICPEPFDIQNYDDARVDVIDIYDEEIWQVEKTDIEVWENNGEIYDCDGNFVNNFRLASPTGIAAANAVAEMSIYPNPSNGQFTVEMSAGDAELYETAEVINALGEVVLTFNVNKTIKRLDLSGQAPGIYLLQLRAADGIVSNSKRLLIR